MFNPVVLHPELKFKAVRSGGKGGQNVNKVSSKVELYFDIGNSSLLNEEQKKLLMEKLGHRVTGMGVLILESQESRSQITNKKIVITKFDSLIEKAMMKRKARIKTKPSAGAEEKRLDWKKKNAQKKQLRSKKIDL